MILTGSIQAGIALDTVISSDLILIPPSGEYIANSQHPEENALSANEESCLKSPFCLGEFVSENYNLVQTLSVDWAADDRILHLFDEVAFGKWVDKFVNLDSVSVFGSANSRVNRDVYPETMYGLHNRIFSMQASIIFAY